MKQKVKSVFDTNRKEFRELGRIEWVADSTCGPIEGRTLTRGNVVKIEGTGEKAVRFSEKMGNDLIVVRLAGRDSLRALAEQQEKEYAEAVAETERLAAEKKERQKACEAEANEWYNDKADQWANGLG